jgi:general secretion pathway protein H
MRELTTMAGTGGVRRATFAKVTGGFSLIEILVVVVIVGIVAVVVVLSIGGDADRHLRHEAERFQALIGEACAEALLRGREIGAVVAADGYSFRVLAGAAWQDDGTDGILRRRAWPDGVRAEIVRAGRPVDLARDADAKPQIVCFSSGEMTPFALRLRLGDTAPYRVVGTEDATLKIERAEARP